MIPPQIARIFPLKAQQISQKIFIRSPLHSFRHLSSVVCPLSSSFFYRPSSFLRLRRPPISTSTPKINIQSKNSHKKPCFSPNQDNLSFSILLSCEKSGRFELIIKGRIILLSGFVFLFSLTDRAVAVRLLSGNLRSLSPQEPPSRLGRVLYFFFYTHQ
jgi:hypothetical protein